MVEEFNCQLNKSVASEETYDHWANYRKSITGFITDSMWKNGSCITLGAGNLMDIDIQKIAINSSELVLTDIDTDAVISGLSKQGFFKNVSVLKSDLGGNDFGNLMDLVSECIRTKDLPGLEKYLGEYRFTDEFEVINYDNVMVSAVYTQLFIPQFLVICEQFNIETSIKAAMIETALKFAAKLISHVNDQIINLAADDASVCVWTDIFEYQEGSEALEDIKNHISDFKWMEEFYRTYIRDYGHGLGSFGILDISERIEIIGEKWLIWPFNENRTMIVKAISGKITS